MLSLKAELLEAPQSMRELKELHTKLTIAMPLIEAIEEMFYTEGAPSEIEIQTTIEETVGLTVTPEYPIFLGIFYPDKSKRFENPAAVTFEIDGNGEEAIGLHWVDGGRDALKLSLPVENLQATMHQYLHPSWRFGLARARELGLIA